MSRADIGTMLARAIEGDALAQQIPIEIARANWQRWASATFIGARHQIMLSATPSPEIDRWLSDLPEAEFRLHGHLVADLAVVAVRRDADRLEADLELLTVEQN